MQWFKLYGQEYLGDPKIQRLTAAERSCWITLLCAASLNEDGIVRHIEENYLMAHSGIEPLSPEWSKTQGILTKFELLGMITIGRDNAGLPFLVIKNWEKRQEGRAMTGYERLKKWRETKKLSSDNKMITDDNGKNRIEENRIEKDFSKEKSSLPILEVRLDNEGKESPKKKKELRDKAAWALREKLYGKLAEYHGKRPVPHMGDYVRVVEARKRLSDQQILEMMSDAIDNPTKQIHTVREVLTARNIQVKINES